MASTAPASGWGSGVGEPTTLVLLRHGVTPATERKLFSGSGGEDPALTDAGVSQVERAAAWIAERHRPQALLASPLLRTRQTAAAVARSTGLDVEIDPGFAEVDFGEWDGLGFAAIGERWPAERAAWLASQEVAPPGGESFAAATQRVLAARDEVLRRHGGRTVVVASHVSPIKILTRDAVGAGPDALYRMELSPASVTVVSWWPDGAASLRAFNVVP